MRKLLISAVFLATLLIGTVLPAAANPQTNNGAINQIQAAAPIGSVAVGSPALAGNVVQVQNARLQQCNQKANSDNPLGITTLNPIGIGINSLCS
ncbi:MAG TPA: hypothetical protein VIO58_08205 [Candidatus Methanoperedens sp.]